MPRSINLGEVFAIPVRLHYTWLPASILIVIALAQQLHGFYPIWLNIIHGIAASLLFLASMYARALAQSAVSINRGMPVRSVTLYVFGGVPRITEQDTKPIPELLAAAAGPVSSLVIAGIFYALSYALSGTSTTMPAEFMQWLFFFNLMMALFNLIPAFPLDGGRGLRAILQLKMKDYSRATRIATFAGQVIGLLLIVVGIITIIRPGNLFAGIATIAFGWFLADAATTARRQALVRDALRGITAHDMMIDAYTPIRQQLTFGVVREYIINSGQHCFLVVEDGKPQGIVTLGDIQIPEKRWDSTRISDIMTPARRLKTTQPNQPAVDLLEQMEDYDIEQIPVVQEDKLVGMVTRERLLRFLKARAVLRA
jgi:Zn-dependent protease/predicted transcriptional regulator